MASKKSLCDMFAVQARDEDVRDAIKVDKERAEADVNYFAEAVLGYKQARIHRDMQAFFNRYPYCVARAPIYFGKSTQALLIRPLWRMARDQDWCGLMNSSSMKNLKDYLAKAQATILQNRKLKVIWPHMKPEKRKGWPRAWSKQEFTIERSDKWADENMGADSVELRPSYRIISTGSQTQGIRADEIICDDPLSADTAFSETQRLNDSRWLDNTLLSRQSDRSPNVRVVGTPHHVLDWCHIIVDESGFAVKTWDGDDYAKLWPEKYQHIQHMRRLLRAPSAEYDRLIKCKARSGVLILFDLEVLKTCRADVPYGIHNQPAEASHWNGYCGIDVAGTKKTRRSANTCFAPWIITPDGIMRLVELRSEKGMSTERKMRMFLEIHRVFPRMIFVVEDNNTQDFLADIMRNATLISSLGATPEEVAAITSRIQTWTTTGERKRDYTIGVPGMDASFRAKRIEYRANDATNAWITHLAHYSPETHPSDDVMAGWLGWAWLHDRQPMSISLEAVQGVSGDFEPFEKVGGIGEFEPGDVDSAVLEMMI